MQCRYIEPGRYILAVSRIEPEKGLDVLIDAFNQIKTDQKLVTNPIRPEEKSIFRSRIEETYNWAKIADQTIKVYEKALVK